MTMSEVTPIVEATANVVEVTAAVIRNATYLERARKVASAHPIAAGIVAVGVTTVATYGAWNLTRKAVRKYQARKGAAV
jgi:hypothetical protein